MREIIVSKSELKEIYEKCTTKEALEKLNISTQAYYNLLDSAGIERKRKGFKRGESIKYILTD
jgi:hypothetical protein